MTYTLPQPMTDDECASDPCAHDTKQGPATNALGKKWQITPGAAHARVARLFAALEEVATMHVALGQDLAFDRLMAKVDELRAAGPHITLDAGALLSIERAECRAEVAREQWELAPTTAHAKAALRASMHGARAHLEFCRGVRTAHPELQR